jgi:NAD+ diphosphatase
MQRIMKSSKVNMFSSNPLNRLHDGTRNDEQKVTQLLTNSNSLFVPFYQTKPLLAKKKDKLQSRRILWQERSFVESLLPNSDDRTVVLLGEKELKYYFAFDTNESDVSKFHLEQDEQAEYGNLREASLLLPAEEAGILAQAKALLEWNSNHRFCGSCGSKTKSQEGGVKRLCTNVAPSPDQKANYCGKSIYPRTDPVVIMLVINNDRVLLGRKKEWPQGMYSCLAGFIDSGETIEEAVKREVKEEAGVEVAVQDVQYHSSQPWPFLGGQLMIGCHAYTTHDEINVDGNELEEARWCTLDQVKGGLENCFNMKSDFRLPPSLAIAHILCKAWVEDQQFKISSL